MTQLQQNSSLLSLVNRHDRIHCIPICLHHIACTPTHQGKRPQQLCRSDRLCADATHTACVTGLIRLCADASCPACVTGQVQLPVEMMVESYHVHGMVLSSATVCPSLESTRPPGCNSPGHLVELVVGFRYVFARVFAGCVYTAEALCSMMPKLITQMALMCPAEHCIVYRTYVSTVATGHSATQCFSEPISLYAG